VKRNWGVRDSEPVPVAKVAPLYDSEMTSNRSPVRSTKLRPSSMVMVTFGLSKNASRLAGSYSSPSSHTVGLTSTPLRSTPSPWRAWIRSRSWPFPAISTR